MPRLKIVKGRDAGRSVDLPRDFVIGRDDGNDLKLQDETCSRHHARIVTAEGRSVVLDLGSNNGTYVNGDRVRERLLQDGDRIIVGKTTLIFEAIAGATRAATVVLRDPEGASVQVDSAVAADAPEPDPGAHLRRLYALARHLNSTMEPEKLLDGLAAAVQEALDADTVVALTDDEAEAVARGRRERRGEAVVSRTVLDRVRRTREALLVSCVPADPALSGRASIVEEGIRSAACAPLLRGERILAVLYVDSRRPERVFGPADLDFLRAAASLAAPALENAGRYVLARDRVRELDVAARVSREVVATDPKMREVMDVVDRAAPAESTVLLLGESGTGKEVLARALHARSGRRQGPFMAVNCAALVESLLESELFGHEKGAFTGADRMRPGKFEAAEGGTLFLDEIGDVSPGFQAKLLRVLQDRSFQRVGGTAPLRADVRIVAATNRNLEAAIKESRFRQDLYYRLSVVTIRVPLLRERRSDIPILAHQFLERARERAKKGVRSFSPAAMDALIGYAWPGNVRELENVIERAAILTDGETIDVGALPAEVRQPGAGVPGELPINLDEAEKICIRRALERTGGKKGEAARLLGISWPTLNKKLKEYGLE